LLLAAVLWPPLCGRAEPADEVAAAFAKLHETTYRKRDHLDITVPLPSQVKLPPVVTECAGGLERIVYEMEMPGIGKISTTQVRAGDRSAVKIVAPGLTAKFAAMQHKLTVNAAKSLLSQIVSIATAVQTGGLSTATWVREAMRAAGTITTTAQARVALDAALKNFDRWQVVPKDVDENDESGGAATYPDIPADDAEMYGSVEKTKDAAAGTVKYTRRPSMAVPGADLTNIVVVDAASGVPVSEENYLNGKRVMRTEYFDIGVPLTIEVPECLK
jgi:hypothetical protein